MYAMVAGAGISTRCNDCLKIIAARSLVILFLDEFAKDIDGRHHALAVEVPGDLDRVLELFTRYIAPGKDADDRAGHRPGAGVAGRLLG